VATSIPAGKTRAVIGLCNAVSPIDLKDAARRLGEYHEHKGAPPEDSAHSRHTADSSLIQ
jgi:hypothetical protein